MSEPDRLFADYRDAMNAELSGLGCRLRIAYLGARDEEHVLLLDADGSELGRLPEHIDACAIAAFEKILTTVKSASRKSFCS